MENHQSIVLVFKVLLTVLLSDVVAVYAWSTSYFPGECFGEHGETAIAQVIGKFFQQNTLSALNETLCGFFYPEDIHVAVEIHAGA